MPMRSSLPQTSFPSLSLNQIDAVEHGTTPAAMHTYTLPFFAESNQAPAEKDIPDEYYVLG